MDNKRIYSTKAEKYARCRWDYAPAAIRAIFDLTGLPTDGVVADLGAGTGILTRHFTGRAGKIYVVEPNDEMRREAEKALVGCDDCVLLDAPAEATGLPDGSVDLITVAQAIHWFEPQAARNEFLRILKPGGWLVLIRNYGTDDEMGRALNAVCTPENGVDPHSVAPPPRNTPAEFYYGAGSCQKLTFPFEEQQDWEGFIGAMLSASYMPDEDHPAYAQFEAAVRQVFERFSQDGWRTLHGVTEMVIGQPV